VVQTATPRPGAKPTVVLVHGAFADSSGWNTVAARLLHAGYPVVAFSNPLRGPLDDAAYLRDLLTTIQGPVVMMSHPGVVVRLIRDATGR
jgi:pimeloyl-ACP methyl ester carboxylesterase